ncbi:hypothetical protein Q1695_007358 [Nippostrongylus brasiliensis]|nr:hypothetical protein Q1695_007358 [Nippostrongylus brasiliensis]
MDVVFFEPRRTSVFVSPAGSKKKLCNHSAMQVAYRFIFSPNSNFYAKPEQSTGLIKEWAKIDIVLYRKPGRPADEQMTIQFAAAPNATDPAPSFATGQPVG